MSAPTPAAAGRRLIGVGVGPGDPELITVKAVRVLREADAVLVPVMAVSAHDAGGQAVRSGGVDPDISRNLRKCRDSAGVTEGGRGETAELGRADADGKRSARADAGGVDGDRVDGDRVDAGRVDGDGVDAGRVDGDGVDAGRVDGDGVDAGRVDGDGVDAGRVDATVEPGRAEATVRAHIDGARIRRVAFALNDPGGVTTRRSAAWDAAARAVADAFADGAATVAFATIGDPNIYSTFTYLAQTVRELVPDVIVETVPGITAMQDLAARSGTVLTEGAESLVLLPMTGGAGLDRLRAALEVHDTVVAYKIGSASLGAGGGAGAPGGAGAVLAALDEAGRLKDAVFGARLGLAGQDVRPAGRLGRDETVPYLSTLIVAGQRHGRGSKLR